MDGQQRWDRAYQLLLQWSQVPLAPANSLVTPIQNSTQELINEHSSRALCPCIEALLGFYDYVARQFDPTLGRFLQADTIVPNPANPQSLNRYSYTLGNPLRYTDPSGHFEVPEGECGELCQLLGFSDWDAFSSWWNSLPDGWRPLSLPLHFDTG